MSADASLANTSPEEPAPYGTGSQHVGFAADALPKRIRVHHLAKFKEDGFKWAMLTAYDQFSASIFDEAGIPALLVGDSAANNVLGYNTTLPVTVEELLPMVRAVSGAVQRAMVVADLPFGSYQISSQQALTTAIRMMKEGRAHAVKLEGGAPVVPAIKAIVDAGIPVMAHLGFTPQSEHALGGYRVQGRGDAAEELIDDALAVQEAGAFAVVLEMVPAPLAAKVTAAVQIPTIGIGAGVDCDAQVLVWQDMAGLDNKPRAPRFVKRFADLRSALLGAASDYAEEVRTGVFPGPEHSFEQ